MEVLLKPSEHTVRAGLTVKDLEPHINLLSPNRGKVKAFVDHSSQGKGKKTKTYRLAQQNRFKPTHVLSTWGEFMAIQVRSASFSRAVASRFRAPFWAHVC